MANKASAIKRIRSTKRKEAHNQLVRSRTKSAVKQAHKALGSKKVEECDVLIPQAIKALDKAASKKIIHPNNAARKKSRLTTQYNTLKAKKTNE
ncbi:MAG TPA: 30S ribosomal protein S20 [bacterium]|nr:30S ribosomal protein S20 [bacterium]